MSSLLVLVACEFFVFTCSRCIIISTTTVTNFPCLLRSGGISAVDRSWLLVVLALVSAASMLHARHNATSRVKSFSDKIRFWIVTFRIPHSNWSLSASLRKLTMCCKLMESYQIFCNVLISCLIPLVKVESLCDDQQLGLIMSF